MIAIISKLPKDMLDVEHILPFWFSYLYWFLWALGIILVLALLIYLFVRFVNYFNSLPAGQVRRAMKAREFTREMLRRELNAILDRTLTAGSFRQGCHDLSAVLRMFFEIQLKKEIEEMTADEIRLEIQERTEIGEYFIALRGLQYRLSDPSKDDFVLQYERTATVVK